MPTEFVWGEGGDLLGGGVNFFHVDFTQQLYAKFNGNGCVYFLVFMSVICFILLQFMCAPL